MAVKDRKNQTEDRAEILQAITEGAESDRSGIVVSLALATSHLFRFDRSTDDGFVIDVLGDAEADEFAPQALCLLAFQHGAQTRVFLSHVEECEREDDGKPLSVRVRSPESILSVQGRTLFRTPLLHGHGLEVVLCKDDVRWAVEPVDISQAGVGVRFSADGDPGLPRGEEVSVEMTHGDATVRLAGTVRFSDGKGRYGLFFPEVLRHGEIQPLPGFQAIVADLHSHWLRTRSA